MKTRLLLSAFAFVAAAAVPAAVSLAPVFGHGMVLQRDSPVPVWGAADPGQRVTVRFAGQVRHAQADASGRWQITLHPLPACAEPRPLYASAGNADAAPPAAACTNVLVGEVWLAAGQSNMEWPLAREAHAAAELPAATNSSLRLLNLSYAGQYFYARPFTAGVLARLTPQGFYSGAWRACDPAAAADFSAVAYYFGREIVRSLNVPVGIIHLAVGGSPAEAWIRRDALASHPDLAPLAKGAWLTNAALDDWCRERGAQNLAPALNAGLTVPGDGLGPNHPFKPGFLWEAGPARLLPFAIRGVLWYQGESNSLDPRRVAQHENLFPLLVRDWRRQWAQPRLPFLYCQLSSISTNGGYKASCWPEFRDQQRRFLDLLPDTAMAVTSDLGHPTDVHPRDKREVGRRLALAACAQVYARMGQGSGPLVQGARRNQNRVDVLFRHAQGLKTSDGRLPDGFELAGEDGIFMPAHAAIRGETVILDCPAVPVPKQVRYAWQPFAIPSQNLVNAADLPASTFRAPVLNPPP